MKNLLVFLLLLMTGLDVAEARKHRPTYREPRLIVYETIPGTTVPKLGAKHYLIERGRVREVIKGTTVTKPKRYTK